MTISKSDILIVGAGMAGLTLALLLSRKLPYRITLLETKKNFSPFLLDQYDHRVSAFSLSSQRIFSMLGVWDDIQKQRVSPFKTMHVWNAYHKAAIDFDCRDIGEKALGYIIENELVTHALYKILLKEARVNIQLGVSLKHFEMNDEQVLLRASDDRVFSAKLAIACDGAHSWLRQKAGILIDEKNNHESAIVATVQTSLPHNACASQIFDKSESLAFLPLKNPHQSSIVWSLSTNKVKELRQLDKEIFEEKLSNAFEYRLGNVSLLGERFSYPLSWRHAKKYVESRVVLVGDAAHTIHPVAGQGINMGLLDVLGLYHALSAMAPDSFFSISKLKHYGRSRYANNFLMLTGVEKIQSFFSSNYLSNSVQEKILNSVNQCHLIKNIFIKNAQGQIDLPALTL